MSKMEIVLQGDLQAKCSHENGSSFVADAPKEVGGKGECFSPTDLVPTAMGSCMLITMELYAKKLGIDLTKATASVEKEMSQRAPRRISKITVHIKSTFKPTPEQKKVLEEAALSCPVHHSIHPDTKQEIIFSWG